MADLSSVLAVKKHLNVALQQSEFRDPTKDPFFSICVPQYNRTSFLIEACRVLAGQTCRDFEICIADDCSTDERSEELKSFLKDSGLRFVYKRNARNLRYDGNLRASISLARGRYCLLMGNDDCLADVRFLERLRTTLVENSNVGVVVTNYADYRGDRIYRRVRRSGVVGSGPRVATGRFRNFSFVSGLILLTERAQAHETDVWDGSEMYQVYLACRIIAEGHDLLELDEAAVRRGITLSGESVDSYALRPRVKPCPIVERYLPLDDMGRLVYESVAPYSGYLRARLAVRIFMQLLLFTYPFWILEYRRVQSWKFAVGICLGMRPRNLLREIELPLRCALPLRLVYFSVTCAGLLTPISMFDACQGKFHDLAKSVFQRT